MSSPQSELDTSSFLGQMAARYRERMSMAFAMSNFLNPEAYQTKLPEACEGTMLRVDNHKTRDGEEKTEVETPELRDLTPEVKPTRSMSNLSRSSYFPKPSMKELITKFERRSVTSNQLRGGDTSGAERRHAKDAWRARCEAASLELEAKAGATPLEIDRSDNMRSFPGTAISDEVNLTPLVSGCESAECDEYARSAVVNRMSLTEDSTLCSEKLAGHFENAVDMTLAVTSDDYLFTGDAGDIGGVIGETRHIELENKLEPAALDAGWSSPIHQLTQEELAKTPSPLRTSLRGIAAREKIIAGSDSKYVVHKKEWGKRFSTKAAPNSVAQSPYTVHEVQSRTKSDGVRSLAVTPTNSLHRAEVRRTGQHHFDNRQDDQDKSSSKSDLRSNAMERYMKFLKHATPPLASSAGDKPEAGGLSRPPTPRRPQAAVNKTKKNQIKRTVLNAAKASGCQVTSSRPKQAASKDGKAEERRFKSGMSRPKLKLSSSSVISNKTNDTDVTTAPRPKRLLDRRKPSKGKVFSNLKVPKVDMSCGDIGTVMSTTPSLCHSTSTVDGPVVKISDRKNSKSTKSAFKLPASKLPTKSKGRQRNAGKITDAPKQQGALPIRQASSGEFGDVLYEMDTHGCTAASLTSNTPDIASSVPHSLTKEEDCNFSRASVKTKKPLTDDRVGKRAKSSPARLSGKTSRKIIQSPKDIRDRLFLDSDKEFSDPEDKLLTEGELANNELIPLHEEDGHAQSPKFNRFGFRGKQSPLKVTKLKSVRQSPDSEQLYEQDSSLANQSPGKISKMSSGVVTFKPNAREKYDDESSEHTSSYQLEFEKREVPNFIDFGLACSAGNPKFKKSLNTNSNLVPEVFSSASTLNDEGNKRPNEDRFISPKFHDMGDFHDERRLEEKGDGHLHRLTHVTKGSPKHLTRREEKRVGDSLDYLDVYSPYTKDWPPQELMRATSRQAAGDEHFGGSNSISTFHFGDSDCKLLDSSDEDGQRTATNSPLRKKRHVEKKKKKKKKKKEDSADGSDVSQWQKTPDLNLKSVREKHTKEKRKEKSTLTAKEHTAVHQHDVSRSRESRHQDLSRNQELRHHDVSRSQELRHHDVSRSHELRLQESRQHDLSKSGEQSRHHDVSKSLEQSRHHDVFRHSEQQSRHHDQPGSGEASKTDMISPDRRYSSYVRKSFQVFQSTSRLSHETQITIPTYHPVQPVSSAPTEKMKLRSSIPVRCAEAAAARRRCDVLQQRRRWIEAYATYDTPCRIPLSQDFRKALETAVIEEYAMHSWFPNGDNYFSGIYDNTDQASEKPKMDTGPLLDSPMFSKDWLIEFLALLPYRRIGPLRMSHVGYLTLALSTLLVIHLCIDLYNCGGDDYDYFCEDDDIDCFVQAMSSS